MNNKAIEITSPPIELSGHIKLAENERMNETLERVFDVVRNKIK